MIELTRRSFAAGSAAYIILPVQQSIASADCDDTLVTDEGPFYPVNEIPIANDLTQANGGVAAGERMRLKGYLLDSDCQPLAGGRIVIWQTDARGNYRHPDANQDATLDPNFLYFAQQSTNSEGGYQFTTVFPQPYVFRDLKRARHIHIEVAHANYGRFTTEMYFASPEDDARRMIDDVWATRDPQSRDMLIIDAGNCPDNSGSNKANAQLPVFKFNIILTA